MVSPDNVFEWLTWTKIMSVEQEKSYKDKVKPEDPPAPELSAIFGRLLTHNPHLDEADLSTAPFRLSRMFQVRRNAYAMCGLAHLASIKILDDKMIEFMTVRHSAESGLRNPTLAELKEADRHVWEEMTRLVTRHAFKWDDVLFEFAEVRSDLSNRLGQRLKPPVVKGSGKAQPVVPPSGGRQHRGRSRSNRARRSRSNSRNRSRQGDRGRGDRDRGNRGGDRGADRGSDRGGDRSRGGKDAGKGTRERGGDRVRLADQWPRSWANKVPDPFPSGTEKNPCMRFHLKGDCNFGATCRFSHLCPAKKSDGATCGKAHSAQSQHTVPT